MNLKTAKEKLEDIIQNYKAKFSDFGIKTAADVYYVDSKAFLECEENDKYLDSLCASITLISTDAKNEDGMCGFDLVIDIKKRKSVNDEKFEAALSEFCRQADELIEKLENAPDKDEVIKEESKREKEEAAESMKKFESDMHKLQISIVIGVCALTLLIIISVFTTMIFG